MRAILELSEYPCPNCGHFLFKRRTQAFLILLWCQSPECRSDEARCGYADTTEIEAFLRFKADLERVEAEHEQRLIKHDAAP